MVKFETYSKALDSWDRNERLGQFFCNRFPVDRKTEDLLWELDNVCAADYIMTNLIDYTQQ